jgi:hypothetical protein
MVPEHYTFTAPSLYHAIPQKTKTTIHTAIPAVHRKNKLVLDRFHLFLNSLKQGI